MVFSLLSRIALMFTLLSIWTGAAAFEPFVVKKIDVQGLQRISVGTVFNYLPIHPDEQVDTTATARALRALYKTGFFRDIILERDGYTLIVSVVERPSIASLKFEGNDAIPEEQLMDNMKSLGFSAGKIFNRSLLDKVVLELKEQYMALGKYSVRVSPVILQLERNRVDVLVKIKEGDESAIQHLNTVGNSAYGDSELKSLFELGERPLITLFSSQDQYAREKLSGDLERLRSFYMDHGYINFAIDSTQVSITPDKSGVYITINLSEGEQYRVRDIKVSGETILSKEEVLKLIPIERGQIFSRAKVTKSNENISENLGQLGYAFANINPIPELDKDTKEVDLNFYIDPGHRIFIRRINITGNEHTKDEVVRRELRQMESGWISTSKVKRSRERLDRLGFFEEVSINTPTVIGTSSDLVDLNIKLSENETNGTFSAGIGYSDGEGVTLSSSVSQKNFLGSGESFSLNINTSSANTVYSFSITDPYSTLNGVSRTLSFSYRKSDATELGSADYTTSSVGGAVNFGVPFGEYNTLRYGFKADRTTINTTATTSAVITDFCSNVAVLNDCSFNSYKVNTSVDHDTRDRFIFPRNGGITSLSAEVAIPISESIAFYKSQVSHKSYIPLFRNITFAIKGELAYAGAYGDSYLPPFEYYRAGGVDSVRGYSTYTLGATPDTFDSYGKSIGGDMRFLTNAELIFPSPFSMEKSESMRFSLFFDAGNVFNKVNGFEVSQLRSSVGAALAWITPVGPLKFSFGVPLNKKPGDQIESFQFTIGVQ